MEKNLRESTSPKRTKQERETAAKKNEAATARRR